MKNVFLIFLTLIIWSPVTAQWQQTNGPDGGLTSHLRKVSGYLFVNGHAGGVFRSGDDGITWKAVNNGLPSYPHCYFLTSYENRLYASISTNGIYFSEDLGETWIPINNGISNITAYALMVNGQDVYAAYSEGGFYYSSDHGATWSLHEGALKAGAVRDFVVSGNKIFAAVNGGTGGTGVYLSEDKGLTWKKLSLVIANINAMSGYDNALYVSDGSLKVSRDYGETWVSVPLGSGSYVMSAIYAVGDKVCIGASGQSIFYSDDEGQTWTNKMNTSADNPHNSILSDGTKLWLATWNGVFYSSDGGDSWQRINEGLRNEIINYLKVDGDTLMAVTNSTGLFNSWDNGASWSQVTIGTRDWGTNVVRGVYIGDGYKVAGTGDGIFRTYSVREGWTQIIPPDGNKAISTLAGKNDTIVAAVYSQGVYTSTNAGKDWTFKPVSIFENKGLVCSAVKGDTIIIGASEIIFISKDFGETWETSKLPPAYFFPESVFFDGSSLVVVALQGIYKSSDLGKTWGRLDDLPSHLHPYDMLIGEQGTYYAGTEEGVYISYNKGTNWYPVNTGLKRVVTSMAVQNGQLFSGTFGMGVWTIPGHQLNVRPHIVRQKTAITITNEESVTLTLEDFDITDPDNESLTLIIREGPNYSVTENVITPHANFAGDLTIPVQVDDGKLLSELFDATARVQNVVALLENVATFAVYPNPASDKVFVRKQAPQTVLAKLVDQWGKVIYEHISTGTEADFILDLSGVTPGLYTIRIQSANKAEWVRIVKI